MNNTARSSVAVNGGAKATASAAPMKGASEKGAGAGARGTKIAQRYYEQRQAQAVTDEAE